MEGVRPPATVMEDTSRDGESKNSAASALAAGALWTDLWVQLRGMHFVGEHRDADDRGGKDESWGKDESGRAVSGAKKQNPFFGALCSSGGRFGSKGFFCFYDQFFGNSRLHRESSNFFFFVPQVQNRV